MQIKSPIEKLTINLLKQLSTLTGLLTVMVVLIAFGAKVGVYYGETKTNKEISEINNRHTLEIFDLRKKISELELSIKLMNQYEKKESKKRGS